MKVAFAAVTGRQGGARSYALSLLRALAALEGPEEYVLLSDTEVPEEERGGVRRVSVPMPGGTLARPLAEALALPLLARRIGADVFHGTKQTLPAGLRCPRVVTVLDLAPHLFPHTFSRAAGIYLRHSTAAAVRRADHVLAISDTTARDVSSVLGVSPDRVTVVPLGVDPRMLRVVDPAEIDEVRRRHGLPERYVLTVGTLQPRKNVDVVLDAVERLADTGGDPPLYVVAGRVGWMVDDVIARLNASPLGRFLGSIPEADLLPLLAGATVFLSPSSYEGFGLAVAEAMAAGTAVIAGLGSASDDVVGAAGVRVEPRSVEAVADALDYLLRDDAERTRLAAAGRARVKIFTWERTARGTREVYRRVARGTA